MVYGPVFDGGPDVAADASLDGGDASDGNTTDAPPNDGSTCTSMLAVVGGSSTALFGAGGPIASPLTAASLSGTLADCGNTFGCANPVAIIRFGGGLLATLATNAGALESTTFQTTWSAPFAIASAATIDGPALTAIGTTAHLLFQGTDFKYLHAQYTTAWDSASDPVGGAGSSQSYGARGPTVGTAGTDLVALQAGSDSYLYDQTWTGSWAAAHQQGGAAIQNTLPPTVIALTGGSSDLLAAYLRNGDYKVMTVNRAGGTWATPMLVNTNAYSNDPVALAPLPGGKALLVFRGSDEKPYFSTWDGATTWTAPAAVVGGTNPMVASIPSVAVGVCGADAVVAWAQVGGGVAFASFIAGAFSTPVNVSGTSSAKFVAIATLP